MLLSFGQFDRRVIDRDAITTVNGVTVPDYAQIAPWVEPRFD